MPETWWCPTCKTGQIFKDVAKLKDGEITTATCTVCKTRYRFSGWKIEKVDKESN